MRKRILVGLTFAGILVSYLRWIRPWQLRWGATDEEIDRIMPGDDIVNNPTFDATRSITVNARPEHIWPWLVQIGVTRAGWYSYDWIDNLGRPSAKHVIEEFQRPQIGDVVPMSPDGKQGFFVKEFDENTCMLWWDKKGDTSWFWGLYPIDDNSTRLVTRIRIRYNWLHPSILFFLALDAGDIVMLRKCLLGIKERAERLAGG